MRGPLVFDIPFLYPDIIPWFKGCVGAARLMGSFSWTQSLIFKSQPEGLHLLS
jgi:hypothetical protein